MARSCGLRIGPRRFELFVLDGSPKKAKVVTSAVGELPSPEEGGTLAAAQVLREVMKALNVPKENVGVAFDARHAAYRRINLPFSDRAKIEQVIKFEIEGQLPQFNVDDVVVDFHVLDSTGDQSSLLVTAIPKEEIRRLVELCQAAGFEPLEVELEGTAMVNAAVSAGICGIEDAQVLVHVGEESTAVAIVDGGKVREMRAIQVGALTGAPRSQWSADEELEEGAEAEGTEAEPESAAQALSPAEEARRLHEIVGRIRRELARTVSAARTANELEAVYLCGFDLPGLAGSEVLGVPVHLLEAFETEEDDGSGYRSAAVAYGTALRQLGGGVLRPSLRREELKYTGAFERLELPLAVAALLLVTLLGVWNIFVQKDLERVDFALKLWVESSNNYMLPARTSGQTGRLARPGDKIEGYMRLLRSEEGDTERTRREQLVRVRRLLQDDVADLEKKMGRDSEIDQPQSALSAMTLVLELLRDEQEQNRVERPSVRSIRSTYQAGKGSREDHVRVTLDLVFFGEDTVIATNDFENYRSALEGQPWFLDFEDRPGDPIEGGKGIYKGGVSIDVDVSKAVKEASS